MSGLQANWIKGTGAVVVFAICAFPLWARFRNIWTALLSVFLSGAWAAIPILIHYLALGRAGWYASTDEELRSIWALSGLTFATLLWGGFGWVSTGIVRGMDELDRMVDRSLMAGLMGLLSRIYRFQWLGWILGVGVILLALRVGQEIAIQTGQQTLGALPVNVAAWASTLLTGVICGNGIYFAALSSSLAVRLMRAEPSQLHLLRLDPAATPGLALIARFLTIGSGFLLFALLFMTSLWITSQVLASAFTPLEQSAILISSTILILLLFRFSLTQLVCLNQIISRARALELSRLDALIDQPPKLFSRRSKRERLQVLVYEFDILSRGSNLPFRTASVVQFAAASAGAVVTFALGAVVV